MVFNGDVAIGATYTLGDPDDHTYEVVHVFSEEESAQFSATEAALGNDLLGGDGPYHDWEAWNVFRTCLGNAFSAGIK